MTFLYAITGGGAVKWGISDDVAKRFRAIQACSPVPLIVVASWPCSTRARAELAEGMVHWHLAADRLHGEWFLDSDASRRLVESDHPLHELMRDALVRVRRVAVEGLQIVPPVREPDLALPRASWSSSGDGGN